ncbi:MAG: FAD:protein FMN transferase, partial [Pseudomonadales bacterium]|nr:FAD:protein FMN transferase [Pseudomonadales bacterium]
DLSAIAKGYGVDRIAELLEARGFDNYLVEIGGELRARGHNDRERPWTIAIETPAGGMERSIFRTVEIQGLGMATSGDYRNYFEVDGVRYSHTIDPITGWPIEHNLASVTVLADSTTWADGMATAINVLGVERGLDLAQDQGLAVQVIIKTEDGFEERVSPAFEALSETD